LICLTRTATVELAMPPPSDHGHSHIRPYMHPNAVKNESDIQMYLTVFTGTEFLLFCLLLVSAMYTIDVTFLSCLDIQNQVISSFRQPNVCRH
jgi:hypothetical protein